MPFIPHSEADVRAMLKTIGVQRIDDLFDEIPPALLIDELRNVPPGLNEMDVTRLLKERAAQDGTPLNFAGAGAYEHHIPAAVWAIVSRGEFYSAYTPYQAEASQGTLQLIYEYQTMMTRLTGMDVSNASLYDGATALAEAVNLARSAGSRGRVLVSAAVDPRYVDTLRTYGRGAGYQPEVFDVVDGRGGEPEVTDDVACVIVQHPNAYGLLEPARELFGAAHAGGARAIQVFDPLSLGVLAPPGDLRADIAVAEGQVLGNHLNHGGPYLGVIATRLDDVRRLPGRLVGETLDVDGRTGYVLTLQAREQHIRREKATSNICTNQTLMAIAATVYLGWLGPQGLEELGRRCMSKAAYAAERLSEVPGVEMLFDDAPFFKEFPIRLPRPAAEVRDALIERGYLGGVPLPDADGHALLVAVTERRSRDEIDGLAMALKEVLA